MYLVLLVEDDQKLNALIKDYLEKYGYRVITVTDFNNVEQLFKEISPDLVLLDINIPYYDGFYLCRVFRKMSKAPVIILSARNGVMEQVMGMELGADDYITKPFSSELLLAKVKAALRRAYGEFSSGHPVLYVHGLSLDENSFKMSYRSKAVELSKNEFKLIKRFLEQPDTIIKREALLDELWDEDCFVDDNTLNVNVARVKSRLTELGVENALKTKRGVGYSFDSSVLEGAEK